MCQAGGLPVIVATVFVPVWLRPHNPRTRLTIHPLHCGPYERDPASTRPERAAGAC